MSCVYPVDAWRSRRTNESGKRGIVFNPRDGFIDQPLQVPCCKCVGCLADRARVWSIRMYHEASQHEQNCFLTLTYKDPAPPCLNKHDLQRFFKRLRKLGRLRYFACGEYGKLTRRPHYHAIVYGADWLGGAYTINETLYSNPIIDKIWGHGMCSIGEVNIKTCMYVAGYVNKKIGDKDSFQLMSRKPGIGHTWLDKYRDEIIRNGTVVVDGKTFSVPKRYLEWYPDDFEKLKKERAAYYDGLTPDEVCAHRENLRSKEINYKARLELQNETI